MLDELITRSFKSGGGHKEPLVEGWLNPRSEDFNPSISHSLLSIPISGSRQLFEY